MKPQVKEFDGSSSLFEIHQNLKPYAGNSLWLTQLQPKNKNIKFCSAIVMYNMETLYLLCNFGNISRLRCRNA